MNCSPASAMALQGNAVLSELRLGLCSIGSEGITKLTETLKPIDTLRVLDISGSTLGLTAGKNLGKSYEHYGSPASAMALQGNAVLSELRLGLCSIGSEGITKLTETLKPIDTLRVLDISGSTLGLTAGKNLGKSYEHYVSTASVN